MQRNKLTVGDKYLMVSLELYQGSITFLTYTFSSDFIPPNGAAAERGIIPSYQLFLSSSGQKKVPQRINLPQHPVV